jgi:phosphate transport system substrate-binding protein
VLKKPLMTAVAASVVVAGAAYAQAARDYIFISGSSTVFPFTTTVAEQFGRGGKFKTPKVESTGTGSRFSAPASAHSTRTSPTPHAVSRPRKSSSAPRTA